MVSRVVEVVGGYGCRGVVVRVGLLGHQGNKVGEVVVVVGLVPVLVRRQVVVLVHAHGRVRVLAAVVRRRRRRRQLGR